VEHLTSWLGRGGFTLFPAFLLSCLLLGMIGLGIRDWDKGGWDGAWMADREDIL